MPPHKSDIRPELLQASREIFATWEAGDLPFSVAVERFEVLRKQALADNMPADEGQIELQLGVMQGYRGNYIASIEHFEKARDLFIRAENQPMILRCMLNLGETFRLRGNFTRARQHFHTGYKAALKLDHRELIVVARANEAQMLISQGRKDLADKMLKESLEMCAEPWEEPEAARSRKKRLDQHCEITHALATLALDSGDVDGAWDYAVMSLDSAKEMNIPLRLGYANRAIAEVMTELKGLSDERFIMDPDEYFSAAIESFREVKADGEIARTMAAHGRSLGKRGRNTSAARMLQQAMVIFTRLGMADDAAKAAEAQLKLL